ncbi:hypothetical protein HY251_07520, partial [bacterium]|nr:hypothetical protein [bacterium]
MQSSKGRLLWGSVFSLVPLFSIILTAMSTEPGRHWWLPEDVSTFGADTDHLFNVILVIVTVAFVITQAILCLALFRYGESDSPRRGTFIHGHHKLEMAWTTVPVAILVFIAFYQFSTWKWIKFPASFPEQLQKQLREKTPFAEVLAGQFEW